MRNGSTADDKEINVKLWSSRNPKRVGKSFIEVVLMRRHLFLCRPEYESQDCGTQLRFRIPPAD